MHIKISSLAMRFLIMLFWVTVIIGFLYMPYLSRLWTNKKTITVITWAGMIDARYAEKFEEETGIKVNIRYYDSNEELFVKLVTTKAKGYDIIITTDYIIQLLIKEKLLKHLDTTKLLMMNRLNKKLLNHYYDPNNTYSIPYFWAIYGLGIDKEYFIEKPLPSWNLIFDQTKGYNVGMLNAPRDVLFIAAQYLFGSIDNLDQERLKHIRKLLIDQKKHVEAYTEADVRVDSLLLSKTCPVVVSTTPFMAKIMKKYPTLDFLVPQEGSFMVIDNIALPATTTKDDYIYEFINYLYRPDVIKHHVATFAFFPATDDINEILEQNHVPRSIIEAHHNYRNNLDFFRNVISPYALNEIWVALKAA